MKTTILITTLLLILAAPCAASEETEGWIFCVGLSFQEDTYSTIMTPAIPYTPLPDQLTAYGYLKPEIMKYLEDAFRTRFKEGGFKPGSGILAPYCKWFDNKIKPIESSYFLDALTDSDRVIDWTPPRPDELGEES